MDSLFFERYIVNKGGLYRAIFTHEVKKEDKSVIVIYKRPNTANNMAQFSKYYNYLYFIMFSLY